MYDINKKIKICSEWFKDHEQLFYSIAMNDNIENQIHIFEWKKPNTSIYSIKYIIRNNYLFVSGDLGCAVYKFSSNVEWHSIASMDSFYFSSKCEASETGRFYKEWNEEKCISIFNEKMKEYNNDISSLNMTQEEFNEFKEQAKQESFSRDSWGHFVQNNYNVFYDDAYDYGEDTSIICVAHLQGILMGLEKKYQKQNNIKTNTDIHKINNTQYYSIHADRYDKMKKLEKMTKKSVWGRLMDTLRNTYE